MYTAPLAIAFTVIWLGLCAVLLYGFATSDGGKIAAGLFGSIFGAPVVWISIKNWRESLRDFRTAKRQRRK